MALKDLLVHVDQSERTLGRLRLAADLARRHGSRLTAIYVRELNPAELHLQGVAELGLGSASAINRVAQQIEKSINEGADRLRSELDELKREFGLEVEWRCLDGIGSVVVPQHARFSDLCILGQDVSTTATATGYTFSEQLLFMTGRPVIFIPAEGSFEILGRHILVAWNSSRPSTRAVNDALPLIERAERVTVLAVNPAEFAERYGALPPEQMVGALEAPWRYGRGGLAPGCSDRVHCRRGAARSAQAWRRYDRRRCFRAPQALGKAHGRRDARIARAHDAACFDVLLIFEVLVPRLQRKRRAVAMSSMPCPS